MNLQHKAHRGIFRKTIVAIAIMLVIFLSIAAAIVLTQKPDDLQISNIEIRTVKDGVYIGSADNGLIKATVSVEVKGSEILRITILEHEQLLGKKAEKITESIIEKQTLEVDAITSATYSSDTLRKAVENALRQGE